LCWNRALALASRSLALSRALILSLARARSRSHSHSLSLSLARALSLSLTQRHTRASASTRTQPQKQSHRWSARARHAVAFSEEKSAAVAVLRAQSVYRVPVSRAGISERERACARKRKSCERERKGRKCELVWMNHAQLDKPATMRPSMHAYDTRPSYLAAYVATGMHFLLINLSTYLLSALRPARDSALATDFVERSRSSSMHSYNGRGLGRSLCGEPDSRSFWSGQAAAQHMTPQATASRKVLSRSC